EAMSSITTMNQQPPRGGQPAQHTGLSADRALDLALKAAPNATPAAMLPPLQQHGDDALNSRVQLVERGDAPTVILVDRSSHSPVIRLKAGDRAAAWIRWIHEGSHGGPVWAVIVFLTGVFPTIFAVTGIIMWLRKRADRKALNAKRANPQLRLAE